MHDIKQDGHENGSSYPLMLFNTLRFAPTDHPGQALLYASDYTLPSPTTAEVSPAARSCRLNQTLSIRCERTATTVIRQP